MKILREKPSKALEEQYFEMCLKSNSGCNIKVGEKMYNIFIDSTGKYIYNEFIADFELTNSFYVPDSNKIPNTFTGIDEIGVTVSAYRDDKNPHWIDNHLAIIGSAYDSKIYIPKHYKDVRSDSFIISIAGYSTSDSSINIIENIYDQQISVGNVGLNQTTQLGYQSVNKPKFAIKLSPTSNQEIKGFKIRLQNLSLFNNSSAYIKCSLYSNLNGYPDTKLVGGSKVDYSQITNYFDETNNECQKAMDKVIELYKENEHGEELVKDIEKVLAHKDPSSRAKEYLKRCLILVKEK